MTDERIQNLLGGFATGALTDSERQLLFTAALKDQELFNALADEEVLREFLSDPASRRRVLQLLQPGAPGVFERLTGWMQRPVSWAVTGAAVAALALVIALRDPRPQSVEMARTAAPPVSLAPQLAEPLRDEVSTLARRDAPFLAAKKEAFAATKMKVAVLEFDSGPAQAKESESKSADLGKTASDLLGKKLDLDGYAVIDRKQVDKAMQSQKLNERQLDASAAASVGRQLGADAVIVGSVKPSLVEAVGGVQQSQSPPSAQSARSRLAATEMVQVTATAINTQNAVSLGFAQGSQAVGGGIGAAVDQVASSLGQQIQQNVRARIEGLVTDVNARILTLNVGVEAGVRVGDRLEIRRLGRAVGRVVINSVQDAFSVGFFEGADPVRTGDIVANQ